MFRFQKLTTYFLSSNSFFLRSSPLVFNTKQLPFPILIQTRTLVKLPHTPIHSGEDGLTPTLPHPFYTKKDLEEINLKVHYEPKDLSDKIAWKCVRLLRVMSDVLFQKRYIHRALVLETVAGVPGMVAGMWRHLTSLRKFRKDNGWILTLLEEAENERMHLLVWMTVCQPNFFERVLVLLAQGVFWNLFFVLYVLSPRTAHRFVGYLEEEAVISYTHFLADIDNGIIPNAPAPQIAINYWKMDKNATLRDVVLVVRADEAIHRDVNHVFSDAAKEGESYGERPK